MCCFVNSETFCYSVYHESGFRRSFAQKVEATFLKKCAETPSRMLRVSSETCYAIKTASPFALQVTSCFLNVAKKTKRTNKQKKSQHVSHLNLAKYCFTERSKKKKKKKESTFFAIFQIARQAGRFKHDQ